MSNAPGGHLYASGADLESMAAIVFDVIGEQGWSPFNPTNGMVHFFGGDGGERRLPNASVALAALSRGGLIVLWAGHDDTDLSLNPATQPAGAAARITLRHVSFGGPEGPRALARFVALWLELARRIDLVVGFLASEIVVELLDEEPDRDAAHRRFVEGRIPRNLPVATVWDRRGTSVDPAGGGSWFDGRLQGRIYEPAWYGVPLRPLLGASPED